MAQSLHAPLLTLRKIPKPTKRTKSIGNVYFQAETDFEQTKFQAWVGSPHTLRAIGDAPRVLVLVPALVRPRCRPCPGSACPGCCCAHVSAVLPP